MVQTPLDTPAPMSDMRQDGKRAAGDKDVSSTDAKRQGVLRQRQHIEDLTGEDPLRGGIAD